MYALRVTRPLLALIARRDPPHAEPAPTTTKLGDWYANRLNIGHHRLILCTSAASLLTVVVPAKDLPGLPVRLAKGLALVLQRIGVPSSHIEAELGEMRQMRVDRTASRSILGSMNDFAVAVDAHFRTGESVVDVADLNERLSETPCGPLGYDTPRMRARALLGAD